MENKDINVYAIITGDKYKPYLRYLLVAETDENNMPVNGYIYGYDGGVEYMDAVIVNGKITDNFEEVGDDYAEKFLETDFVKENFEYDKEYGYWKIKDDSEIIKDEQIRDKLDKSENLSIEIMFGQIKPVSFGLTSFPNELEWVEETEVNEEENLLTKKDFLNTNSVLNNILECFGINKEDFMKKYGNKEYELLDKIKEDFTKLDGYAYSEVSKDEEITDKVLEEIAEKKFNIRKLNDDILNYLNKSDKKIENIQDFKDRLQTKNDICSIDFWVQVFEYRKAKEKITTLVICADKGDEIVSYLLTKDELLKQLDKLEAKQDKNIKRSKKTKIKI